MEGAFIYTIPHRDTVAGEATMTLLATDDLKTPEGKWNNCSFKNNTVQLNDPTLTIHPPPRKKDIKCSQGDKVVVATMRKSVLEGLEYFVRRMCGATSHMCMWGADSPGARSAS